MESTSLDDIPIPRSSIDGIEHQSDEPLFGRLRRRLSRAPSNKPPKPDVRSLFAAEAAPKITLNPAPLNDFGSLLSETGYDSDAQYVGSSRLPSDASLSQQLRVSSRQRSSPIINGQRGLGNLSEQSHESAGEETRDSPGDRLHEKESREKSPESPIMHGERPAENSSSQLHQTADRIMNSMTSSLSNASISSSNVGNLSPPASPGIRRILPSARSVSSSDTFDEFTPDMRIDKRRLPGHESTSIAARLASAGSSGSDLSHSSNQSIPRIQLEDSRHQSSLLEVRSVHLCDLNIPRDLASSPMGLYSMSRLNSIDGEQLENIVGSRSVSVYSRTTGSPPDTPTISTAPGRRGLEGNASDIDSTDEPPPLGLDLNTITVRKSTESRSKECFNIPGSFLEHSSSTGGSDDSAITHRQDRVAGLSGGRRIGYGYLTTTGDWSQKENDPQ